MSEATQAGERLRVEEFAAIEFANRSLLSALKFLNQVRSQFPDGIADRLTDEQLKIIEELEAEIVKEMP